MIINRTHIPWILLVLIGTAISALFYLANIHPDLLSFRFHLPAAMGPIPPVRNTVGGTPLGIVFGLLSLAIFIFAVALGVRKKRRTWPLGSVRWWLKAHVWLTILTIPWVCFHCDFKWGGPMTTTLLVLYIIVMASGFFGLALQQFMPSLMTRTLPREVVYEQIPYVRGVLLRSAEALWEELAPAARRTAHAEHELVAASPGVGTTVVQEADSSPQIISEFLHDEIFPFLNSESNRGHRLSNEKTSEDMFRLLRRDVTERWRETVDDMQQWCDERRMLDTQASLQHWLHGWLILHVPTSFALIVLTIWHGYVTLMYL